MNKIVNEMSDGVLKKIENAYKEAHGVDIDWGFAPDRAWAEGYYYATWAEIEPCNDPSMGEHACDNRNQCWEPCGVLGHDEEHVQPDFTEIPEPSDEECHALEIALSQPFRDSEEIRAALELALEYWQNRQQRYKNRIPVWVKKARAALAAQPSGQERDAEDAARCAVERLPRFTFGYVSDEWGMGRSLMAIARDDGKYLRREDVLAAIEPGSKDQL